MSSVRGFDGSVGGGRESSKWAVARIALFFAQTRDKVRGKRQTGKITSRARLGLLDVGSLPVDSRVVCLHEQCIMERISHSEKNA